MEKSSKRGKIPQSDWPLIMARYEAGETLASIARTYDCSPPAISYVVSRSRARVPGMEAPARAPSTAEAQLIKASPGEAPANGQSGAGQASPPLSRPERPIEPQAAFAGPSSRQAEPWPREANGFARNGSTPGPNTPGPNTPGLAPRTLPLQRPSASPAGGSADGDQRRTLHLSLGNGSAGNGGTPASEHHLAERQNLVDDSQPTHQQTQFNQPAHYQTAGERAVPPPNSGVQHSPAPPDRGRNGAGEAGFSEARAVYPAPVQRADGDLAHRKNGASSYIDKDLRARVDGDIAAFLAAFDAALAEDTQESRSALREATDRLLRAGARTRIELERLEARMPLPPRDNIARYEPAWRQR
jgi:hypothetical protein